MTESESHSIQGGPTSRHSHATGPLASADSLARPWLRCLRKQSQRDVFSFSCTDSWPKLAGISVTKDSGNLKRRHFLSVNVGVAVK